MFSWFFGVSRKAKPVCAAFHAVLDHVALDRDALRVLELDEVLDRPIGRGLRRRRLLATAGVHEGRGRRGGLDPPALTARGRAAVHAVCRRARHGSPRDGCGVHGRRERDGDLGGRVRKCPAPAGRQHGLHLEIVGPCGQRATRGRRHGLGAGGLREHGISPGGQLDDVVALDDNVARDEVRRLRVGAAEHDVLGGALEVVVVDDERSRTVEAGNGLGVARKVLAVTEVAVQHVGRRAIECETPLLAAHGVPMDVHAISVIW